MKNVLLFVVLIVTLLGLAACGGQPTPANNAGGGETQNTPAAGGDAQPFATTVVLDPAVATESAVRDALGNIYEGLVRMDGDQPVPALAVGVTPSEDQLDYIFSLRPGVAFHDGTPFNADAVLANFNRWFDPQDPLHGTGVYAAWVENFGGFKGETDSDGKPTSNFDGIEKVDELSVIVHLRTPDPDLLVKLTDPAFSIVSPAALQAAGFGSPAGIDGGTGPYRIGAWDSSGLTLEPNSSYWNADAIPSSSIQVEVE